MQYVYTHTVSCSICSTATFSKFYSNAVTLSFDTILTPFVPKTHSFSIHFVAVMSLFPDLDDTAFLSPNRHVSLIQFSLCIQNVTGLFFTSPFFLLSADTQFPTSPLSTHHGSSSPPPSHPKFLPNYTAPPCGPLSSPSVPTPPPPPTTQSTSPGQGPSQTHTRQMP